MDSLLQKMPIQRPLFKSAGEPHRLNGSCLMAFSQPRRRGRLWLALAGLTGTVMLLAFASQMGLAG
jgi:hypothetical protein